MILYFSYSDSANGLANSAEISHILKFQGIEIILGYAYIRLDNLAIRCIFPSSQPHVLLFCTRSLHYQLCH